MSTSSDERNRVAQMVDAMAAEAKARAAELQPRMDEHHNFLAAVLEAGCYEAVADEIRAMTDDPYRRPVKPYPQHCPCGKTRLMAGYFEDVKMAWPDFLCGCTHAQILASAQPVEDSA